MLQNHLSECQKIINMIFNMTIKKISISEAKVNLSKYLASLPPGGKLILCNRNIPVGEILLYKTKSTKKRKLGMDKGKFIIPDAFFEPLPSDIITAFGNPK